MFSSQEGNVYLGNWEQTTLFRAYGKWSRDSSVGIVIRIGAGCPRYSGLIPRKIKSYFYSP
jgi:hypothetical protein